MPDIFGLKEISREPAGPVSIESLKARPSRRSALDRLLDRYALEEYEADRPVLKDLLHKAATRLGLPRKQSDLGDPEFMVLHALNRINPNNWREATVQTADGPVEVLEYVPPAAERDHLKPLQDEMQERTADAEMEASIRIALNNAGRSSPAFAAASVKWAQEVANKPAGNETQQWMREEAIVSAALIAARDGGADLIATHGDWIRETFRRAFKAKHDPVHRTRDGLQYNPIAIAFVGTALLLKNLLRWRTSARSSKPRGITRPQRKDSTMWQGFSRQSTNACPAPSCAAPSPRASNRGGNGTEPEEDHKARLDARQREVAGAIEAETAWLNGRQDEPAWPAFEVSQAHSRRHYSLSERHRERQDEETRPEQYTDHQAAALWLGKAASIFDVSEEAMAARSGQGLLRTGRRSRTARNWRRTTIPTESRMNGTMRISTCWRVAFLG